MIPGHRAQAETVEPSTVVLGTLKKAERDDTLIVRLIEMAGATTTATLTIKGRAHELAFAPYEIKTLKLWTDGRLQPVNLIEEPQ